MSRRKEKGLSVFARNARKIRHQGEQVAIRQELLAMPRPGLLHVALTDKNNLRRQTERALLEKREHRCWKVIREEVEQGIRMQIEKAKLQRLAQSRDPASKQRAIEKAKLQVEPQPAGKVQTRSAKEKVARPRKKRKWEQDGKFGSFMAGSDHLKPLSKEYGIPEYDLE
jgi:hypothetical protein